MQDYNTFDNPDVVIEKPFNEININKNVCKLDLPPYSVVEIRIK